MQRRKFLETSLKGVPLLFFSSALLQGCKDKDIEPNGKSVLIVGAGMAGLAAAIKLT